MRPMSLFISCLPIFLLGQSAWVYRYNGPANNADAALSIAYGADGNIYAAGSSGGNGTGSDFTVISLTPAGDTNWVYRYNGPQNIDDGARAIAYGLDGNIYAAGGRNSGYGFIVISLTPAGDTNWVYVNNGTGTGECKALSLTCGADSNIYAAGYTYISGQEWNYTVISLDRAGSANWVRAIDGGGHSYDEAIKVIYGADGWIYSGGYMINNVYWNVFVFMRHYRSTGYINYEDNWTYGCANDLAYGGDTTVYAAGRISNAQGGPFDLSVRKYQHGSVWTRRYDGSSHGTDMAYSIAYGGDGNIYCAGYVNDTVTGNDLCVISLTPDNILNWTFTLTDLGNSQANSIVYGSDGYIYVGGYAPGATGNQDFIVICLSSTGDTNWVYRYNGPGNGNDVIVSMVYGADHRLYAAGSSVGNGTNQDFTVIGINTLNLEENMALPQRNAYPLILSPNPCRDKLKVTFDLPVANEPISLYLYDVSGRLVQTLWQDRPCSSGSFFSSLNPELSTGIYYLILKTIRGTYMKNMTIIH